MKEVVVKLLKYVKFGILLCVCCAIPHTRGPIIEHDANQDIGWSGEDTLNVWGRGVYAFHPLEEEITFDVPMVRNDRVEFFVQYYQNEAYQSYATYLKRSVKYIEPMRDIFKKHDLPQDLVYLALIESGYNPFAYSRAHAMGPWQFLAGTARIYGLSRNKWVDERRDPVKSTEAAARYLKDLYEIFEDWYLVLAAYNTGQSRVLTAMKEAQSRDYWALDLPTQTEDYVPRFLAATIIAKNPEQYGFDIAYEEPFEHEVMLVPGKTDLKTTAACLGCEVDLLRRLNPELKHLVTPPNASSYPLRIPRGSKEIFDLCCEKLGEPNRGVCRPQG
ncbi:MAG: lytic transglycosylase domain-containing protein [Gemmatimonadota bacterium]|nr:MAG: lytic transglycosylase domain-containing protein [Gemmatimonadota bacterium]